MKKCCRTDGPNHANHCRHFRSEVKTSSFEVVPSLKVSAAVVREKIESDRAKKRREQEAHEAAKKAREAAIKSGVPQ